MEINDLVPKESNDMISFKLLLNHAKGGGDVAVGGVGFMAVSITRMGLVGGVEGV